MALDLNISELGEKFIDLRGKLPGDSFNWNFIRPLESITYLAIHHSGTEDTQTPQDIANFHIGNNGWGGIGYHFLIDKEGNCFYVGDLQTARASVANLNDKVIGICLIGNFVEGALPTPEQIESTRKLCQYLIDDPIFPALTSLEAIAGHKDLPNQSTPCPGDSWNVWREKIVHIGVSEASKVENLQASLASINEQYIRLQEALIEKERELNFLKSNDHSLTIADLLINLFRTLLPPGKVK